LGGAFLSEHPKEGQAPDMKGSVLVLLENSREDVIEKLNADVYSKSGVWDVANAQILPFKTAIRSPQGTGV
jgi:hypothetical protein